ncbi:MAG: response regulator [Elusimicrobia bacterium]|nr:response regulator [Elusimicrobiota bacterium]
MKKPPRILVVDDYELVRTMFEKIGRRKGIDIKVLKSGQEAVKEINADSGYSLIFIDLKMPYMGGAETLDLIKKDHPELPVIIMTGSRGTSLAEKVIGAGAADFITKPFELREILKKINKYCGTRY